MDDVVVYVADIDQDIDDFIAIEYLSKLGVLKYVVLDPIPVREEGILRKAQLLDNETIYGSYKVSDKLPKDAEIVFCGGALTAIANHLRNGGHIDTLVMNGGFVGSNIVPKSEQLDKFKKKEFVRTFNFNLDVESTDYVLKSEQINNIILVGKNVCHSIKNTKLDLWNKNPVLDILNKYNVRDDKRQHDVLACHEGLIFTGLLKDELYCEYLDLYPCTENDLDGNMTKWGSTEDITESPYRICKCAVGYVK